MAAETERYVVFYWRVLLACDIGKSPPVKLETYPWVRDTHLRKTTFTGSCKQWETRKCETPRSSPFIVGGNKAQRDKVTHVPRISDFRASTQLM